MRTLLGKKKQSYPWLQTGSSYNIRFKGANSSAGEHLPYKQGVGGSNPSSPTKKLIRSKERAAMISVEVVAALFIIC